MPSRPLTLVIVDDDHDFRSVARQLFTLRGHTVLGEAGSAACALSAVRRCLPDVVMVDVHLGHECGFELTGSLTREHPGLAVVLMSADEEAGAARYVHASGARGFVPKAKITSTDLSEIL